MEITHSQLQRLVDKHFPQHTLSMAWDLRGGVSANVTALEIQSPSGQTKKLVLRRFNNAAMDTILVNDYNLLKLLRKSGIPVPEAYVLDISAEILSMTYMLVAFLEGVADFIPLDLNDYLLKSAEQLVHIHRIPATDDFAFVPRLGWGEAILAPLTNRKLDESLSEGLIRETLAQHPLNDKMPDCLLHGDYWRGNILWRGINGENPLEVVGVIDWEDAMIGNPLFDVANCRLETLWAFGREAMQTFTTHYHTLTQCDLHTLPYWDLCVALRPAGKLSTWGLDAAIETQMRQDHRWFVEQAIAALP